MCSPELRDDKYNFLDYTIEAYERGNGPPLISKKSRLIVAATNNDLPTLKELLDSPKWYEVRDAFGLNLLQIAILRESDEIFDYLLSLDDFPLEAVNDDDETALVVALIYCRRIDPEEVKYGLQASHLIKDPHLKPTYRYTWKESDKTIKSHYAYKLLKKGVNIPRSGEPLLHFALKWTSLDDNVVQLLIDKGADINERDSDGLIPLELCHQMRYNEELFMMLLCYGADASKRLACSKETLFDRYLRLDVEGRLIHKWQEELLEILLYFTHDKWNLPTIDGNSLLKLGQHGSPTFSLLINFTPIIVITHISQISSSYCLLLLSIKLEDLQILIEKYPYFVKTVLQNYTKDSLMLIDKIYNPFRLENLDMLLHSSLRSDTMELIFKLNSSSRFFSIVFLLRNIWELSNVERIKMIYYLLSYGMPLYEQDLDDIYKITGYSEDFKNLLFMDLQKPINMPVTKIIPRLLYDVTLDIHSCVKDSYICWRSISWNQLFDYFAHPKFKKISKKYTRASPRLLEILSKHSRGIKCNNVIVRQAPKIPLLQEVARDAFRKYFVETFEIKTAKKFYSLIKLLRVNDVYKKIITFETKLYSS